MAILQTVLLVALASFCHADTPPSNGYGAPDTGYGTPDSGYGTPDSGYGTPDTGYGTPTGTGYDQGGYDQGGDYNAGYGETTSYGEDGGEDLLAKVSDLIPLFIAVFAAIILAQLLSPLLMELLALIVGILPMGLAVKAPIINMILAQFNLQLCTTDTPPEVFPPPRRSFSGRALKDMASGFGFDVSEDKLNIVSNFLTNALENTIHSDE